MKCDRAAECGFYGQLVQMKIIRAGQSCGKPIPEDCPRHQFANGINVELAQKVLREEKVLESASALTHEESLIMFPKED